MDFIKIVVVLTLDRPPNPSVLVPTLSRAREQLFYELWIIDMQLMRIDTYDRTLSKVSFAVVQSHRASSTDRILREAHQSF